VTGTEAGAWEGGKRFAKSFYCKTALQAVFYLIFSFPSPCLGTHLPVKPRLPVTGDGPKPGLRAQMRSQAGAWERVKRFAKSFYCKTALQAVFYLIFLVPKQGLGNEEK